MSGAHYLDHSAPLSGGSSSSVGLAVRRSLSSLASTCIKTLWLRLTPAPPCYLGSFIHLHCLCNVHLLALVVAAGQAQPAQAMFLNESVFIKLLCAKRLILKLILF